ncbi:MAG: methylenetetrahydrofolate--tRNA-(uracil(54)-C(5))-methyltransferase (FADH(2)-oxidizing) TrmFO [Bacilli bacterium]|nr:methylenetetrahydrofolate--tRNA-(uracil(54)-C(5))-methyltransferase (FADH(2)-oxidizing) TrmFO [Bacilli bacterium]
MDSVTIIGAGLAGSEAAYQLAKRGISVDLYEMKKIKKTQAQTSDFFAELVCSNSLRSNDVLNAAGLMKEELRRLDSLVIRAADKFQVPAGSALAVDRELFSQYITEELHKNPLITIHNEEVTSIDFNQYTMIATGPLTSEALMKEVRDFLGEDTMYFYDAIAPIVEFDSIDMSVAYFKSRYDKGTPDYINCPMTKEQYDHWYQELLQAKTAPIKDFELKIFEGCMPFEEMARRGEQTLLYGPMKPVGLAKEQERRPYAVVQLRQDNLRKSLYNIVGFQTHLTFPEQKRLIRMIPGLENANIVRYGIMHRNSFINSPKAINQFYQSKQNPNIFFAGQFSGVEGYVESIGSGLVASINMARLIRGMDLFEIPQTTALGSQSYYISHAEDKYFQPMNTNFGIFPELGYKHSKKERKELYVKRSLDSLQEAIDLGLLK